MTELWRRILFILRRRQFNRELDEEMRVHVEMLGDRRRFGNATLLKEVSREMWTWTWLETLGRDLRYGLRMLARSPGFAAVAVLSLALGIGANTTMFSVVDALLLKVLPVRNPQELAVLRIPDERGRSFGFSYPLFEALRDHNRTLAGLFTVASRPINVGVDGYAEMAPGGGLFASGGYYSTLGVGALVGRTFTTEDDRAAQPVAVIGYNYWMRRFALDPSVVGKAIHINGHPFTVIGVMPRRFFGAALGASPDVTVPMSMYPQLNNGSDDLAQRESWWLSVMVRLRPDVTIEQAGADLTGAFQQYLADTGGSIQKNFASRKIVLEPARSRGMSGMAREAGQVLWVLMAVVGAVLLIACANMANLLLARGAARQKEIAVRLSVGGGRSRLIRQLLTESLLIAGLGGAAGLLLAHWGTQTLPKLLPGSAPFPVDLTPDARVLAFTIAVSVLTGLLFGLAPAFRATRLDLTSALKQGNRDASGGRRNRLRSGLVVSQVGLSLILLVVAGLFIRSLQNLMRVELGFRAEHVLALSLHPALAGYKDAALSNVYESVVERIEALPGVQSASMCQQCLLSGGRWTNRFSIVGYPPQAGQQMSSSFSSVGARFFETAGIPILLGRDFSPQDSENAPKVAVVSESFAKEFFPNESPIGRAIGLGPNQNLGLFQIAGVVKDSRQSSLRERPGRMIYFPMLQLPPRLLNMMTGRATLAVRTSSDPQQMAAAVRGAVLGVDKNLPIYSITTLTEQVDQSAGEERAVTTLAGIFGVIALALACVGLYGMLSYSVSRRTSEIGIRMALGAERLDVLRLVLREGGALVGLGIAIGLAGAFAASRVLSGLLFGLAGTDPIALGAATVVLIVVTAIAGYVPARRAARVDPMVALRHD